MKSARRIDRGSKTARATSAAVSATGFSPESASYRARVSARYLRRCGPCVAGLLVAVSAGLLAAYDEGVDDEREANSWNDGLS